MTQKKKANDKLHTTGQNLIRIVISSYFLAAALGLIDGTHAGPLLEPLIGENLGRSFGGAVTFVAAFLLLCGIGMRLNALFLASVTLVTSTFLFIGPEGTGSVDAFWRDLALIAALMLTYLGMDRRDRSRARILRRRPVVTRIQITDRIVPRRVKPSAGMPAGGVRRARLVATTPTKVVDEDPLAGRLNALRAEQSAHAPLTQSQLLKLRLRFLDADEESAPEIDNIFVDLPRTQTA